jgi:hypothetical protein
MAFDRTGAHFVKLIEGCFGREPVCTLFKVRPRVTKGGMDSHRQEKLVLVTLRDLPQNEQPLALHLRAKGLQGSV